MTERIKCIECDNMILPQTAAENGGLCAQCVRISAELRQQRREHLRRLSSGEVFHPSQGDWASARRPVEFGNVIEWQLEPEFYAENLSDSVSDVVKQAATQSQGCVFFVCPTGSRLNLSFTDRYGVCEYQNYDAGDFLCAYTSENLQTQVSKESHVVQACPCCGVGLLWYPSRFHMPRQRAFQIMIDVATNVIPAGVDWLDPGDISYTQRGEG